MEENFLKVRQSKKIFIAACIAAAIFECVVIGLTILFAVRLMIGSLVMMKEKSIYIMCMLIGIIFSFVIATIWVYVLMVYNTQIDIYSDSKLVRKRRDKIVFELPYENIISIRQGYELIFFCLKSGIVKTNGKKGPRNFVEHYSASDIMRIRQLIGARN